MPKDRILNKEQLEAVEHDKGPLLIIAGAGSGKTTVISERIKYLILKKGFKPSEILALTFSEKAAIEMEERVDMALPYGYTQMWISTFHSFCDRVLRSEAIHIGLTPNYKLLTEAGAVLFLRKNLFKFNLEYFRPLGNPNKFLEGMLQHFSRLKDEDVNPLQYMKYAKEISNFKSQISNKKIKRELDPDPNEIKKIMELANAYKIYEELKVKESVMDFSDLISNTLRLFRERKNILKNYQNQFKYILVDEFQDTNFAQNELAILLCGLEKNITVVGDDDQAIYRWRGAAIANMIQFKKYFPKAKIVTLTKNYRSTKEILDKSYNLIQNNNPDRLEIKEKVNKKLVSIREVKGKAIEFLFAKKVEDEAELVIDEIKKLKNDNTAYKDIAILVRANDHSQPFVRALERNRIPYQFLGPGKLFHQEEIKDLIAYLKVLYNFEDSSSLYRVLIMPIFRLEPFEIASLLNFSRKNNCNLLEGLESVDQTFLREEAKEKVKIIYEMIQRHIKLSQKETAGQILYYFLKDTGLLKELAFENQDEKKAQNIARFFDKLKTFEVEHEDASIFAVLDWINLSMEMGEGPLASNMDWSENNAVNILTIHSSKGLEFEAVFLVNLVEGRFPTRERKEQIPIPQKLIKETLPEGDYHLQEERRLFYVGMTRAKDRLFLSASNFYGEGKRIRKMSPFLYEALGQETAEKAINSKREESKIEQLSLIEWSKPNLKPETPTSLAGGLNPKPQTPVTYLSYSQIQTFDICPLHYKLKYILKIPTAPSCAQSFGTSVHSALRDFYQMKISGQKIEIKDASSLLEKIWIKEGYHSKDHEKEAFVKAKKILIEYLEKNLSTSFPLGLEVPFQFLVNNGKQPLKIGGRIDRIDNISNNKIEIIDYKTGSNMPDEKKLANDMQLTFYALAATEVNDKLLNKKADEVLLSLYYLEEGKKLTTTRTKKQLEEAKDLILKKAEEISKSDFACSHSNFCVNCEYKILCQV